MPKSIGEMNLQELVERMNKIRDIKAYSINKGYQMMGTQLDQELTAAQERYEALLKEEQEEYEELLRERRKAKGYEVEEEEQDPYIVFETSERKKFE